MRGGGSGVKRLGRLCCDERQILTSCFGRLGPGQSMLIPGQSSGCAGGSPRAGTRGSSLESYFVLSAPLGPPAPGPLVENLCSRSGSPQSPSPRVPGLPAPPSGGPLALGKRLSLPAFSSLTVVSPVCRVAQRGSGCVGVRGPSPPAL